MINQIEPGEWTSFLAGFSERNRGRKARFEIFGPDGVSMEEDQEARFESASVADGIVTVTRTYEKHDQETTMTDRLPSIRGISVQNDTDNSEDVLEFTDKKNALTTLHFESRVDGDS
jgi:hypothetical protein